MTMFKLSCKGVLSVKGTEKAESLNLPLVEVGMYVGEGNVVTAGPQSLSGWAGRVFPVYPSMSDVDSASTQGPR